MQLKLHLLEAHIAEIFLRGALSAQCQSAAAVLYCLVTGDQFCDSRIGDHY